MAGNPTIRAIIDSSGAAVGAQRFNAACRSMTDSTAATTRSLISFKGALGGLAIGLIVREIAQAAREVVQAGDTFAQTKAKLALFAQEGVNATDILAALTSAAQRSNAPIGQLSDIYSRNAAALNNMGVSTSDQIRLAESLYKTLVISGNATESGRQALIQFSQSLNSGVFRGQEFNSVNEQATEIIRALARETGKTQGELRKLANDGALTAQVAVNALLNDSKTLDAEFRQLPQTVSQASTRFSDMFSLVIGQSTDAAGSNKALASAINEWTNLVGSDAGRGIIDHFSNALKDFASFASDAAREIKIMATETALVAEQQQKAADTGFTWAKALQSVWIMTKAGLGFWADQAGAAITGTFGMTPEQQRALREQAKAIADWNTTTSPASAIQVADVNAPKKPIQFGAGDNADDAKRRERIILQINKQISLEQTSIEIRRAAIAGDTSQVQVLQTQLEIRQRISDDMRKASPEKAAQLENEIRLEKALEIQLKAVREAQERNTQFANDFASTITNAFGSAVRGGQKFSETLKSLALDIAAVLDPLGKSIGSSLSGALNGGGSGGFDIGNIFGSMFGGGDVGLGSWGATVTPFAAGGVVDKPTGFAFSGGLGVAGEDGPEAIMPLSRGRNGDLGVNVSGMGGSNVTNVNITITGDATDATIAKMYAAAEQVFAQKTPGLINDSASEVARRYRNSSNYLRR